MTDNRRGMTLMELMVVLAILALAAGLIGGPSALPSPLPVPDAGVRAAAHARAMALSSGAPRTVDYRDSTGIHLVTAYPDGRTVGDDPVLTTPNGRPARERP